MRLLVSLLVLASNAACVELPYFAVLSKDVGAWPQILQSVGFEQRDPQIAHILVARSGATASAQLGAQVEKGVVLIVEGKSSLAEQFGFISGAETVTVNAIRDLHKPDLPIVWERSLTLPLNKTPETAQVFARDRWTGAPVMAGVRIGGGAVLWLATSPGDHGYERFPYILAALGDLGVKPLFRSDRLWAFFDASYRTRVDLQYLAAKWRKSGISRLHVAAWHYYEPDAERDRYLAKLIDACHREGILVYAWFELPHVSDQFWEDHPDWREKTAMLQDAQLDWRKLMNLTNRACFRAVATGVKDLTMRFSWDGVNLAELYFESLEGIDNPSRFTPMNPDVRAQFKKEHGFDPIELFGARKRDARERETFLHFRAQLAWKIQDEWIAELASWRAQKSDLDLVLTQVDDRFDSSMRDAIGADSARVLPQLENHAITMLVEDPATVWNLSADRYRVIADQYRALASKNGMLAIDLNIVDRYQDVYPTKQQTGTELFQLLHSAAANFHNVALYFENSLLAPDLALLSAASTGKTQIDVNGSKWTSNSDEPVGIAWEGPGLVDGMEWPVMDGHTVWLPAGSHSISPGGGRSGVRLLRFNGELRSARVIGPNGFEFSYESTARAIAILDRTPHTVVIDGRKAESKLDGTATLILPRGSHLVTIAIE